MLGPRGPERGKVGGERLCTSSTLRACAVFVFFSFPYDQLLSMT